MNKKRVMNFCYGMGAAVVIVGALFKITHIELGPLNGNNMLTVGLLVEAAIFAISAFESVDEEFDWSIVYPELKGGEPRPVQVSGIGGGSFSPSSVSNSEEKGLLSEKLDNILKEAKIDANLMDNLRKSIENFGEVTKSIVPTAEITASTNKYAQEMNLAAAQLESLNQMYKAQLDSASKNAEINVELADNNLKLKEQMQSLTANLSTLNAVYGGMLSAMGRATN